VPPVVPKEQRKKNPDKAVFDKTLTDIEGQIESKKEKIRFLGGKKKETLEGGKVSGSSLTFRDFIKEKRKEAGDLKAEKQQLQAQKEKVMEQINALTHERDQLRKTLPDSRDA
jgi:hypothetical protein